MFSYFVKISMLFSVKICVLTPVSHVFDVFCLLFIAFIFIDLSDIFDNNDSIPCHGSGTFVEICKNGLVKKYVINRRRIVPLFNEMRTILIENGNLQSLPQCSRGVIIYLFMVG